VVKSCLTQPIKLVWGVAIYLSDQWW